MNVFGDKIVYDERDFPLKLWRKWPLSRLVVVHPTRRIKGCRDVRSDGAGVGGFAWGLAWSWFGGDPTRDALLLCRSSNCDCAVDRGREFLRREGGGRATFR